MGTSQGKIQGLRVLCNGERNPVPFKIHELDENDPIFSGSGILSPLSKLLELPILVRKDPTNATTGFQQHQLDNQPITYLMINTATGLAPDQWKKNVGSVIIARQDKKPLLPEHFECLWDFISNVILEEFGNDDDDDEEDDLMSKTGFQDFWEGYMEKYPTIPSPYEMK